jgi:hypothetical protein
MERELGEVKGELKQINKGIDRLEALAEKTLTATAGHSATLKRIEKTLDQHELRLKLLEETQQFQGLEISDIRIDVKKHIENEVPLNVEIGKWSTRILWGALATGWGLVVAYLHRLFFRGE